MLGQVDGVQFADALTVVLPTVLPDNRVISGQLAYGDPLFDALQGAKFVRGLVGDLDLAGCESLKRLVEQAGDLQLLLVVAICPGSRTWDDVLGELLQLQQRLEKRVEVKVLARRAGPERAANLLWVQPSGDDHGQVIVGNVGNLLRPARWDRTDAVLGVPLEPLAADALRKWFDGLVAQSRPLTAETAKAPRLSLPEGDPEGRRQWEAYLDALDRHDEARVPPPSIDAATGEVREEPDAVPAKLTFPSPASSMLLKVQTVLAAGCVVALDQASRAPPLSAPVRAELFGERGETQSGAAKRRQSFSVSLFDDDVARRLQAKKSAMTTRLASCSLMLRDGVRWVPDAALDLLEAEFDAVEQDAQAALKKETGDKEPTNFVESRLTKLAADCAALAKIIAPDRPQPLNLVDTVKADLISRLRKNLEQGIAPGFSRSRFQLVMSQTDREGPWDQVLSLLASAARMTREIICNPRSMSGMKAKPEALLAAFNVFDDPLISRYLRDEGGHRRAQDDLDLIKAVEKHETAKPKQKAYALFRLISGEARAAVEAELEEEKQN